MDSFQLEEITIAQVHAAYRDARLNVEALVSAYLKRIHAINNADGGPKLNALLALNKDAVDEAKKLDIQYAREGKFVGPLHGIPIVVKDHVKTKSITTTFGSIVAKDFIPSDDATIVTKLKAAGAIILAKGALPDWGTDFFSNSSLSGTVKNPYDLERDTGGSSSGTAAAVAANLSVVGVGSDSAGSIRIPASFCNVVGFRPTVGLVSGHGASRGIYGQSTLGPMARTVTDAALLFDSMIGFDENDIITSIHVRAKAPLGGSYAAQFGKLSPSDIRLGVVRDLFGDGSLPGHIQVNSVLDEALKRLVDLGVQLVDIEVPALENCLSESNLLLTRSRYDMEPFMKENLQTDFASLLAAGHLPKENLMIPYVLSQGAESPYDSKDYGKQVDARVNLENLVAFEMAKHNVSALLFPEVKIPPPKTSEIDMQLRAYLPANFGLSSTLRWPSICLPAGFTTENLPVGLEMVGLPLEDQALLNSAHCVEQVLRGRRAPAL